MHDAAPTPAPQLAQPTFVAPSEPLAAYDINGAAQRANVGRSTIITAMDDGSLPARKSGRRTIILDDDLMSWLRSLPLRKAARAAA